MKIVAKTDIGKKRSTNQDSYVTGELPGSVAWAVSATEWAVPQAAVSLLRRRLRLFPKR